MNIVMVRHGSTPGNELKRYIGVTDESLSRKGMEEVRRLKERLWNDPILADTKPLVAVSPMQRTWQTAQILLEGVAWQELRSLPDGSKAWKRQSLPGGAEGWEQQISLLRVRDFRECDFGAFENKNHLELAGRDDYQNWLDSGGRGPFPGGEVPDAFQRRCCLAFLELLRLAARMRKNPKTLLIVAHGGTIMSIAERFALNEEGAQRPFYKWYIENANAFLFKTIRDDLPPRSFADTDGEPGRKGTGRIETGSLENDHFLRRTGCIRHGEATGT